MFWSGGGRVGRGVMDKTGGGTNMFVVMEGRKGGDMREVRGEHHCKVKVGIHKWSEESSEN